MQHVDVHDRRFRAFYSAEQIRTRVLELGQTLNDRLSTASASPPLFLGILNGAAMFHADLVRACRFPLEVAYLRTRSYAGLSSSGKVHIDWPEDLLVTDRQVILVEDIVDSGRTLVALTKALQQRGAADILSVVLLDKPAARVVAYQPDYHGFAIADRFVVGYGLDYDGLGRNLPGIYQLAE